MSILKIAHRGNYAGRVVERENEPEYLQEAILAGYDVEVDVWVLDGVVWLGHDAAQYQVEENFLQEIGGSAWFHCKNLEALELFNKWLRGLNYFWHEQDNYTLTSCGYVWTYPGVECPVGGVIVSLDGSAPLGAYGVCGDYLL